MDVKDTMSMEEMNRLPELITSQDVASILGVSSRQAAHLAKTGKLPAVRIGRIWRFNRRSLLRMVGLDGAEAA